MSTAAQINAARPTGRRLVCNLEMHPKVARVDYPLPMEVSGTGITLEEMEKRVNKKLSAHYGVDFDAL